MSPLEKSDSPLKVAVIGCGGMGSLIARRLHDSPGVRISGLCDVDRAAVELVARHVAAPAFIDHVRLLEVAPADVVVVATPDDLHVEPTLHALQAGCHVFCEKPLATTLADARRLSQTAFDHKVHLAVDYNRRFGFGYAWAADVLKLGDIGTVRHASIHVSDHWPRPSAARRPEVMLTTLLTHHIDLVRWLVGEIEEVQAWFGPATDDQVVAEMNLSFRCRGDATAGIAGLYRREQTRTHELAIIGGTDGEIRVHDVCRRAEVWSRDPDCVSVATPDPFAGGDVFSQSMGAHLADFLKRCAAGETPAVSGDDGVRGLQIVEAAIQSHRSNGARVATPCDLEDGGDGI